VRRLTSAPLLLFLALLAACHPDDAAGPTGPGAVETPFGGTIILGRPTDRSVTASLLWDKDASVVLEYRPEGATAFARSAATQLLAGTPVNVTLSGLSPDTRYAYRVRTGSASGTPAVAPPEYHFHTQRAPGKEFVFDVDADPHHYDGSFVDSVYATAMRTVLADEPDFLIDLGDSFMTEKQAPAGYAQVEGIVASLRPFWAVSGPSVPLLLAIGNHEGEQGWKLDGTAENVSVWATKARQKYYPNPVPGGFYSGSSTSEPFVGVRDGYYAFTWGDALFMVLDPYWYTTKNPNQDFWNFTLGAEQYAWLKKTLRESKSPFKFVFTHQLLTGILGNPRGGTEAAPFYEWGGLNADGSWGFARQRPGWDVTIHQLFVETEVTAVFHGHDHFFAKQELDGIEYQMLPQPSYARTTESYSAAEYGYRSGVFLGSSGYLRLRVSPTKTTVEYVKVYPPSLSDGRKTGDVAYTYTLTPR
jgi:hypothetical protein